MNTWHYVVNGAQAGPMSEEALAGMIRSGQLTPDTLVWKQGMADWVAAQNGT